MYFLAMHIVILSYFKFLCLFTLRLLMVEIFVFVWRDNSARRNCCAYFAMEFRRFCFFVGKVLTVPRFGTDCKYNNIMSEKILDNYIFPDITVSF